MKCAKCQTDNLETRKFCKECGTKIVLVCTYCESENLPGDKFCGECGQNLVMLPEKAKKDLSFDEKLDKIQRDLPKWGLPYVFDFMYGGPIGNHFQSFLFKTVFGQVWM